MGPGNGVMIVVGGAAESLNAHPGTNDLTLKKRMGFVKVAIRAGADLVPVFAFGENDIFDQADNRPGTKLRSFQKQFQSVFGFTTPFFHGRGVFNYDVGILPHRKAIHVVVGRPVKVVQHDNPPTELVEKYHKAYIQELERLYDQFKDEYLPNRKKDLGICD
jgi:2-acylglycerol O-acyltransferase 2